MSSGSPSQCVAPPGGACGVSLARCFDASIDYSRDEWTLALPEGEGERERERGREEGRERERERERERVHYNLIITE